MALNPKLKIVLIREGSLLDSDTRGVIYRMAADRGYHVIEERVDETGEVGVYIEDGEVVAVDGKIVSKTAEPVPA